jgi:hypothetical protein
MGRLPSKSGGAAYHRLHRRLLRPVYSNVVINNVTAASTSASERYVRSTAVCLFIMFCEYMFSCYLFPFILLFSTSSMFKLHVVVVGIVMFNIMELIMEIVPNSPTYRDHHPIGLHLNQVGVGDGYCNDGSGKSMGADRGCHVCALRCGVRPGGGYGSGKANMISAWGRHK